MDAPERGALTLVCLVAVALIGFGVIDLSLHWIGHLHKVGNSLQQSPMQISDFVLPAILFFPGIVILIKARSIAEWISNRFDE